jgi:hypothetical protein
MCRSDESGFSDASRPSRPSAPPLRPSDLPPMEFMGPAIDEDGLVSSSFVKTHLVIAYFHVQVNGGSMCCCRSCDRVLPLMPSRQMPSYDQAGASLKASFVGMEGRTAVRAPQSKERPAASCKKETARATEEWESQFIVRCATSWLAEEIQYRKLGIAYATAH